MSLLQRALARIVDVRQEETVTMLLDVRLFLPGVYGVQHYSAAHSAPSWWPAPDPMIEIVTGFGVERQDLSALGDDRSWIVVPRPKVELIRFGGHLLKGRYDGRSAR